MIRSILVILAILAGVFLLATGIMYFNAFLFNNKTKAEIRTLKSTIPADHGEAIQNHDLSRLPGPVRKYLAFAKVTGQPAIRYAFTKRHGKFRMHPGKDWMSLRANTYHVARPTGYIRDATMASWPLSFCIREKYGNGRANLLGKLFGAFTVMNENNEAVNKSSLLRFLTDLPWMPSALASPDIKWTEIDEIAARATISDGSISATAVFFFESDGSISHIYAKDLFRKHSSENWTGFFKNYKEVNGFMIPTKGAFTWNLEEGDFQYQMFEVSGVEFR